MNSQDNNGYGLPSEDQNPTSPAPQQSQQTADPYGAPYGASSESHSDVPHGQQVPPYAAPPYMNGNGNHQNTWGNEPYPPQHPKKAKKEKKHREHRSWNQRVVSGILAVALVAGGCGITAFAVNAHWKSVYRADMDVLNQQLHTLQRQLEDTTRIASGSSVSGSPAAPEGYLTPSQVYAKNVSSVVAISSVIQEDRLGQVVAQGSGSGFILTEDGYVVTNHHVIEGAQKVSVILSDKNEYEAKVIGSDVSNDVAVLKIEAEALPAVTLGSSSDLLIGDMVVAIGNPLGELTFTQTVGYICGKDRDVTTGGTVINMLQTDAAINAGNSGGPLFNMKGEVVGITTAKYSGTTGSGASIEGIGFAIPIDDVMGIANDLVELGYVTGAYLGVTVQDMDPRSSAMYDLPMGAYIVSVVEGGSADRAGIQPKDIVVGLGEYEVNNRTELTRALRHFEAGETTTIAYVRGGVRCEASITLDEKPKDLNAPQPSEVPMPSEGDYDEWYDYFNRFFGNIFGSPKP